MRSPRLIYWMIVIGLVMSIISTGAVGYRIGHDHRQDNQIKVTSGRLDRETSQRIDGIAAVQKAQGIQLAQVRATALQNQRALAALRQLRAKNPKLFVGVTLPGDPPVRKVIKKTSPTVRRPAPVMPHRPSPTPHRPTPMKPTPPKPVPAHTSPQRLPLRLRLRLQFHPCHCRLQHPRPSCRPCPSRYATTCRSFADHASALARRRN